MKPFLHWKVGALCFMGLGFITFSITITILSSPSIFKSLLAKVLVFTPSSASYKAWKETDVPMFMKVYMFNWTNPEEFGKKLPNFVEMGPYVFKEIDYKLVESWNDNGTMTFRQKKKWIFEESMSGGSLSDLVTNINPVVTTVAYLLRNKAAELKELVNGYVKFARIERIVTKSVKTLLFDGYDDRMLNLTAGLTNSLPLQIINLLEEGSLRIERLLFDGDNDPAYKLFRNFNDLPLDKFGYFYKRNYSEMADGVFNMRTGATGLNDLSMVQEWNYDKMSHFYTGTCAQIKGSLGNFWPPLLTNDTISLFLPDICTTLTLKKSGVENHLGIRGSAYTSSPEMFDNGTKVPSRKCFCVNSECQPSGTLNISPCRFGAPVFVSLPHFYLADESYKSALNGMKPDKIAHEFKLLIDPVTGIPLKTRAGLQLNFLVEPVKRISLFEDVPKTFFPILWFKLETDLSLTYACKIGMLTMLSTASYRYLAIIFMNTLGLAVIVAARIKFSHYRGRQGDPILPKSFLTIEDDKISTEAFLLEQNNF